MKIGYARVSTEEQNLELQLDALSHAGCDFLFTDHGVSGANFSRPGLDAALAKVSEGDSLVVWRLDRLGRSLSKLVDLLTHLGNRNIDFVSLNEAINTSTPGGILVFHMMAALAEFERTLISERTRAGIAAARARGKEIGRKRSLTPVQRAHALAMLNCQSQAEVAQKFNVHPRTLRRLLQEESKNASLASDKELTVP
ncbi:recombinase family protein [Paraburkholderia domus]|nr:recombinase family protein [Paraburkholderia domus]MBK5169409.1 recombinase family protein [Burkholderia sp. R-70211]